VNHQCLEPPALSCGASAALPRPDFDEVVPRGGGTFPISQRAGQTTWHPFPLALSQPHLFPNQRRLRSSLLAWALLPCAQDATAPA